ncbi:MAG: homocysteine S-methyltransferase family protein [Clostridia bacterium]|nr:homocysteine S-methyltransferase family protein [Clostridia bacterium]
MNFKSFLQQNIVFFDGGMGSLLQKKGLAAGELPERWNVSRPEIITQIHTDYYNAGSHVVTTNTFGANGLKFEDAELEQIIAAALANAKAARAQSTAPQEKFIALDIGPSGKLLKPLGDLDFEDAVALFAKTVALGAKHGADLILIETMNDCYETKAALLAAKESCDLPIIVSNAYGEDGKLMTGATPAAMVAMVEGMGADAIGANCSLGPEQLIPVANALLEHASIPVLLQPNAGLPKIENGKTVYDVTPAKFGAVVADLLKKGLRIAGGCCGTTPAHIEALCTAAKGLAPKPIAEKHQTVVSSYTHAVAFEERPILIGERINPTGKKRFKQALIENDIDYILSEGVRQQEAGVQILDVNVGLPEIDEPALLETAVCELQAILDLPLQIDTADIAAMERALRRYNGKALINSVNGKRESMEAIFPLVKKYGGTVIALTLDENGIPATAEGRFAIAERILATAARYGIGKKDLIFDTLAMTISADNTAALATLGALKRIRRELGCHTSLGVSNISFSLPRRDAINSTFFAMALENGLSAAIMNPFSDAMMQTYYTYNALKGFDPNCAAYMEAAARFAEPAAPAPAPKQASPREEGSALRRAIVKGLKEQAGELTRARLAETEPLALVNTEIIPALDEVGAGFEKNTLFLPQLLMSAEAAKAAFAVIKETVSAEGQAAGKGPVILATVEGDIHDIGKNIVKLLLENYGYRVLDLGKDVPPERIVEAALANHAPLVGLSALMTTTVPAMEETIKQLRQAAPDCRVMVGGAVLTQAYADQIGADHYAKDAMDSVRYAETVG